MGYQRAHHVLTDDELDIIESVAAKRERAAIERGRPQAHGYNLADSLATNRLGVAGEYAVHLFTGLPWNAFLDDLKPGGAKPADVGTDIEVRTVNSAGRRLIVHEGEPAGWRFVSALLAGRVVILRGWAYGIHAKHWTFFEDPTRQGRPAYFVPMSELRPISELRESCQTKCSTLPYRMRAAISG